MKRIANVLLRKLKRLQLYPLSVIYRSEQRTIISKPRRSRFPQTVIFAANAYGACPPRDSTAATAGTRAIVNVK